MSSDPLSTTTPAVVGIDNPDCVKWRGTLPSQEKSAGRDIPMGQLVTKVLVSREHCTCVPTYTCAMRHSFFLTPRCVHTKSLTHTHKNSWQSRHIHIQIFIHLHTQTHMRTLICTATMKNASTKHTHTDTHTKSHLSPIISRFTVESVTEIRTLM